MRGKMIFWMLTYALLLAAPAWAGDFTDNGNGTITDNNTGLIWQQQDDGQPRNWEEAIAYCEGLSLANQTDWRLPNVKELESITNDSRMGPAIDPIFPCNVASLYWSSTTSAYYSYHAWFVYFGSGFVRGSPKDYPNYVRCVRAGQ